MLSQNKKDAILIESEKGVLPISCKIALVIGD